MFLITHTLPPPVSLHHCTLIPDHMYGNLCCLQVSGALARLSFLKVLPTPTAGGVHSSLLGELHSTLAQMLLLCARAGLSEQELSHPTLLLAVVR